ncbi:hypothetical protein WJX74_001134 [Apatococcus lobatus]|uniref:Amino acid transporter transmembrane domain-containing protein n=1 Tax=Apatococcus lobatus TaxID=904363 RepID=A0AAW1S2S6_9CHLO
MGALRKEKQDEEAVNGSTTVDKLRRVSSAVSSTISRLSSGPVVLASDSNKPQDDTLPVTSRQEGTWWSMASNVYLATMGVAILNLPYAMASITWVGGVVSGVIAYMVSFYTMYLMLELHEHKGRRFNRYRELGELAFGPKGRTIAAVPQYMDLVGDSIAFLVLSGQSMRAFYQIVCDGSCPSYGQSAWIVTIGCVALILCLLPDMSSISFISAGAALAGIAYTAIAFGGSISEGLHMEHRTGRHAEWNLDGKSTVAGMFDAWAALGTFVYPFGAHVVTLELQAQIPSPFFKTALVGSIVGYAAAGVGMGSVAFAGYWAFGEQAGENIFIGTLSGPKWMLALADACVVANLLGQWQLFIMPIFDAMEGSLQRHVKEVKIWMRYIVRILFTVGATFVAVSLPFFGDFVQLIGAVAVLPDAFILPALIYQRVKKPPPSHWKFWANWGIIVAAVIVLILAAAGAGRSTILSAIHNEYYQ